MACTSRSAWGEDDRLCLLVVIGVREDGVKDLLAVEHGYRESTDSWAAVLRDLRDRGLNEPKLVTGDGALGAWAALTDVFPGAGEQRCWVHQIANVLDALPKRLQPRAKTLLHQMMKAPTERDGRAARETFPTEFAAKYPRAVDKLDRDWRQLTALYAFPAEALAPPADHEPDRLELRHRQAAHPRDQARRTEEGSARDGVQAAPSAPSSAGGASTATSWSSTSSPPPRSKTGSGPRRAPDAGREDRRLISSHPQLLTIARAWAACSADGDRRECTAGARRGSRRAPTTGAR
jgi:uncharacterized membrane-anchored protein YhcB (DUF1043 family)